MRRGWLLPAVLVVALAITAVAQAENYVLWKSEHGTEVVAKKPEDGQEVTKIQTEIQFQEPDCEFILESGYLQQNDVAELVIKPTAVHETTCHKGNTRFSKIIIKPLSGTTVVFEGYEGDGYPKVELSDGCVYKIKQMRGSLEVPGVISLKTLTVSTSEAEINNTSEETEKGCAKYHEFTANAALFEEFKEDGHRRAEEPLYIT